MGGGSHSEPEAKVGVDAVDESRKWTGRCVVRLGRRCWCYTVAPLFPLRDCWHERYNTCLCWSKRIVVIGGDWFDETFFVTCIAHRMVEAENEGHVQHNNQYSSNRHYDDPAEPQRARCLYEPCLADTQTSKTKTYRSLFLVRRQ